jgi:hypothetical protein
VGAGFVCIGGAGTDDEYLARAAWAVFDWVAADFCWIAFLSVLAKGGAEVGGRAGLKASAAWKNEAKKSRWTTFTCSGRS